ncbi:hypothetical protein T265_11051 [Opisthorchis viverrini]|uniref:Uncharacterized protein n=1 Tax=Opisthorchis viverrini TaxID=6198 RepID=A0A074Z0E4_OPIVI|nr:hypothetical protein T265_11051 [Opisthorchis viverrini]KER20403.1 hypothetical protein T265_11051 [Opisthorchis viverrini]
MCERGWAGKDLGKRGAKRHHKLLRDNIQGITKPTVCHLARRANQRILCIQEDLSDISAALTRQSREVTSFLGTTSPSSRTLSVTKSHVHRVSGRFGVRPQSHWEYSGYFNGFSEAEKQAGLKNLRNHSGYLQFHDMHRKKLSLHFLEHVREEDIRPTDAANEQDNSLAGDAKRIYRKKTYYSHASPISSIAVTLSLDRDLPLKYGALIKDTTVFQDTQPDGLRSLILSHATNSLLYGHQGSRWLEYKPSDGKYRSLRRTPALRPLLLGLDGMSTNLHSSGDPHKASVWPNVMPIS